ncbi:hypothetical protein NDA12_000083 [Ustilago hordei]|nr:hypothetical protein NDA12_000083 [Ustilago hordei]KAJ1574358.1 hypothetical protein NDA15_000215 [Ustilago hordei]
MSSLPPSKRYRTKKTSRRQNAACDQCRERRSKCVRSQDSNLDSLSEASLPPCQYCLERNLACTSVYVDEQHAKRKCVQEAQRLSLPIEPLILQASVNKDCSWTSLLEIISCMPAPLSRQSSEPMQDWSVETRSQSPSNLDRGQQDDASIASLDFADTHSISSNKSSIASIASTSQAPSILSLSEGSSSWTAFFNPDASTSSLAPSTVSTHPIAQVNLGKPPTCVRSLTLPFMGTKSVDENASTAATVDSSSKIDAFSFGGDFLQNGTFSSIGLDSEISQPSASVLSSWNLTADNQNLGTQVSPPSLPEAAAETSCEGQALPIISSHLHTSPQCESSISSLKRKERDENHVTSSLDLASTAAMSSPIWQDLRNMWCNSLLNFLESPATLDVAKAATPGECLRADHQSPLTPTTAHGEQTPSTCATFSTSPLSSISARNTCASSTYSSTSSHDSSMSFRVNPHLIRCDSKELYNAARTVFSLCPVLPPLEILARRELRRFRSLPDHLVLTLLAIGEAYGRPDGVEAVPVEGDQDFKCSHSERWSVCNDAVLHLERKVRRSESSSLSSAMVDDAVTMILFTRFSPFFQQGAKERRENLAQCIKKLCGRMTPADPSQADSGAKLLSSTDRRTIKLICVELAARQLAAEFGSQRMAPSSETCSPLCDIDQIEFSQSDYPHFSKAEFLITETEEGTPELFCLGQTCEGDTQLDAHKLAVAANVRLDLVRVAVDVSRALQLLSLDQKKEHQIERLGRLRESLLQSCARVQSHCTGWNNLSALSNLVMALRALAETTLEPHKLGAQPRSCEAIMLREVCAFTTSFSRMTYGL